MKSAPFEYHVPERADEVGALLREYGDEAKILAGGQSLIPMLALRLTVFGHLVDVTRIDELAGVERHNGSLTIGAATLDRVLEHDDTVATAVPLVARATPYVGHFQIRNRGTIGGSLAHADPAAEYPAVALALDADLHVLSPDGPRTVPAAEFFTGLWTTALGPEDLLTAVTFPVWEGRCGFAVEEFARRDGDFAIAGACVGVAIDDHGRITRCAIGLIGLGGTPERGRAAEAATTGVALDEVDAAEVGHLAMSELDSVPSDAHGSGDYHKRVGAEMVRRAWIVAAGEARNG